MTPEEAKQQIEDALGSLSNIEDAAEKMPPSTGRQFKAIISIAEKSLRQALGMIMTKN